jgi:peptidoglycan/xylan/chitin deacetylase (PgdA/CDA1 family)
MPNLIRKSLQFIEKKVLISKNENLISIGSKGPVISFSFDDFPVSAAQRGAEILSKYNVRATYYISLGKVGQDTNVGKICDIEGIRNLIEDGHEIGNHTYEHVNMNHSSINIFEESILKNDKEFKKFFKAESFETLSYPYGVGTKDTIRIAKKYFRCARTTNKGINYNRINLFMLKANPVYGNGDEFDEIENLINLNIKKNGWLNLYTHDVDDNHSEFGCSPEYFERVVKCAVESGAKISTLIEACDFYGVPSLKIFIE